jgi:hypothetical protein
VAEYAQPKPITKDQFIANPPPLEKNGVPTFIVTDRSVQAPSEFSGECRKVQTPFGWVWPTLCSGAVYGIVTQVLIQASYSNGVTMVAGMVASGIADKVVRRIGGMDDELAAPSLTKVAGPTVAERALARPETFVDKCVKILVVNVGWVWPAVCGFASDRTVRIVASSALSAAGVNPTLASGVAHAVSSVANTGTRRVMENLASGQQRSIAAASLAVGS